MTDLEKAEVNQNKAVRGYIIRCLVKGFNNQAVVKQLSNSLVAAGMIYNPDISRYLDYLISGGYVRFIDKKVTVYSTYANEAMVKLTKDGIDLAEGTLDDPGVDV